MPPVLHPWLNTPEAARAAGKAVQIPLTLLPKLAMIVGTDELHSEALAILTECALPPRDRLPSSCAKCGGSLEAVRAGAKFCGPVCRKTFNKRAERGKGEHAPSVPQGHIGSMWEWPEDERAKYAIRTVGYVLNNYLRTRNHASELPSSHTLGNLFEAATGERRNQNNVCGLLDMATEGPDETPREYLERFLDSRGIQVMGGETFEELAEAAAHARGGACYRRAVMNQAA